MARKVEITNETVHGYVAKNPGVTAEEIAKSCGFEDRDKLGRTLRKLRETGHLKAKGVTRAMKYTATRKALA